MLNKAILIGNLGKAPELKFLPNQTAVTNMSVATSFAYTDKQTGERVEKTDWHQVEVFGKAGEACVQHLTTGSQVYVEGRMKTDKWDDEKGTHYRTKIVASTVKFLGRKPNAQPADDESSDDQ